MSFDLHMAVYADLPSSYCVLQHLSLADVLAHSLSLIVICQLTEINAAMKHGKQLVVKAGFAARTKIENGKSFSFVSDEAMLESMPRLIDVENADATVPGDKEVREHSSNTLKSKIQNCAQELVNHLWCRFIDDPRVGASGAGRDRCNE